MNFDYGFTCTSYEVITFDDHNLPRPFPGAFFEDKRNIITTEKGPLVYISYGCAVKGYEEYSYFEFYKSAKELCGRFIAQTEAVEDYVDDFFTRGPSLKGYHSLVPTEKTSISKMVSRLEESTHLFQERYEARKKFERSVETAKLRLSAYQGKCDAHTFKNSGGTQQVPIDLLKNNTKLSDSQLTEMENKSNGVISIHEFLKANSQHPLKSGVVLGLNHLSTVDGFSSITGLEHYGDTYERYYGNVLENDKFMDDLTNEGKPIIFLLPNDVLTHEKKGATARELEWLLTHPEKMKNVTFVLGAYDCIPESGKEKIFLPPFSEIESYVNTYQDSLARRTFKQIIANNAWLPKNPEIYEALRKLVQFDAQLTISAAQSACVVVEDLDDLQLDALHISTPPTVEEID